MSNSSSKRCSSEDVEKRNLKRSRQEEIHKNEKETLQCFRAMKLPINLRIWPIFNLLPSEFIPRISSVMVYGSLRNSAIIETKSKNVYNLGCIKDDHLTGDIQKIEELCGKGIKTFACSENFILALTEEGEIYYWKFMNKSGERFRFIQVAGLSKKRITKIACGSSHSLALTEDGKVYAWGRNNYGEIGIENSGFYTEPRQIKYILENKIVIHIACGSAFNIVMTDENKLYGWGNNEYGQISIDTQSAPRSSNLPSFGSSNNVPSQKSIVHPREITIPDKINKIDKIACGYRHTLALSTKGKIYVWGDNNCGQLGVNERKSFVQMVETQEKMSHIAAYGDLSVAVEYENIIYVWGDCGFGQHITTPFRTRFSSIHEPFAYYSRVMHKPLTVNIYDDEEELNILDSLEAAFDNPSTSDHTIKVEGRSIYVHESILKIRCQHLRNKLQHRIKNHQTTSSSSSLTIDKFSYTIYKAFLKYLYTDTIDIPVEKIIELMKLADTYRETNLKKNCIQIIKQAINVSNAALFYNQAIECKAEELEEICVRYMCDNCSAIMLSKAYKKLDTNITDKFIDRATKEGVIKT